MARRSTFRPIRGWALPVAAAAALAACQTQGSDTAMAPGSASKPAIATLDSTETKTAKVSPSPAEPQPDPPKPDELVGMGAEQVAGRIGRPDHVWREPPAAVWQYAEGGCVLHVFLYPADGTMRVRHVELRGEQAATGRGGCYAGLVADRTTPAAEG